VDYTGRACKFWKVQTTAVADLEVRVLGNNVHGKNVHGKMVHGKNGHGKKVHRKMGIIGINIVKGV